MTTEEHLRFARVLGEAFDVGERLSAHDGFVRTRAKACRALLQARNVVDDLGEEPIEYVAARIEVASALVALLTLAGQLGLDDMLTDVDAIVRACEDDLDQRYA